MNAAQSLALVKPAGGASKIKLQRVIWNVSHLIVLASGLEQSQTQ
jgi:hypothetical protein